MKVQKFNYSEDNKGINFKCPGCGWLHYIRTEGERAWSFNGDFKKPTLSPSIKSHHDNNYCCHFFIKEGHIQFLNDCTHELKGKTIEMPDFEGV